MTVLVICVLWSTLRCTAVPKRLQIGQIGLNWPSGVIES